MSNQNRSDSIGAIAAALAKAQRAFTPATLNSQNPFLKNRYADLTSIVEATADGLADNGLSFVQMVETGYHYLTDESFGPPTVSVETLLLHESGEWLSSGRAIMPIYEEKGLSVAQVSGKAITYLRRYQLSGILGVRNEEDTDGNLPQRPAQRPATQRPATQQPPKTTQAPATSQPAPATSQPAPAKGGNGNGNGDGGDRQTAMGMWSAAFNAARKAGLNPPMLDRAWSVPEIINQAKALEERVRSEVPDNQIG